MKQIIRQVLQNLGHIIAGYDRNLAHQLRKHSVLDSVNYIKETINYDFVVVEKKLDIFPFALSRLNEGCICEFGVYKGETINYMASLTPKRKIFGFDSFQGLPVDWETPKESFVTPVPQVKENVKLFVGWFHDTIPKFLEENQDKIAFVNVDCDVYESTKTVLESLDSKITNKTLMYLDDYFVKLNWQNNVFKAFQEFIKNTKKFSISGNYWDWWCSSSI
jgi:hypothetical protein